jgi:hypothetical protein
VEKKPDQVSDKLKDKKKVPGKKLEISRQEMLS